MKVCYLSLAIPLLCLLVSCGGSNASSSTPSVAPPTIQNLSPGGIWNGTDPNTGLQIVGLIDEAGNFHFVRADGTQYVGQLSTVGNSVSGTFQGYTEIGTQFTDGSVHGTGSVSGSINGAGTNETLTASITFVTDAGSRSSETLNLSASQAYYESSVGGVAAISTIQGSYGDAYGDTATVYSNGQLFYQSATTGCTGTGTVSIPNSNFNLYKVNITLQGCMGVDAPLNNVPLQGEGFDGVVNAGPSSSEVSIVTPIVLTVGLSSDSNLVNAAITIVLKHN